MPLGRFTLFCALLSSACTSSYEAPPLADVGPDAASHADAGSLEASDIVDASDVLDARVVLDAALEMDASDEDASEPEPECPLGWTRQYDGFGDTCGRDNVECRRFAAGMCLRHLYTVETCAQAGGTLVGGDSCPGDTSILGSVVEGDDSSLCCRDIRSCAPQLVQFWGESVEPAWFWDGEGCLLFFTVGCVGPDCDRLFASEDECLEAYGDCVDVTRTCGVGSGGTCFDDEYCAYPPGLECGAGDFSASCQPRPESCDDVSDPVCACDRKTYANACEAARADLGLLHLGSCESFEGYCTAPCGLESDEAVMAECEAITDHRDCFQHALGESDASVLACRWTNEFYASDCPAQ